MASAADPLLAAHLPVRRSNTALAPLAAAAAAAFAAGFAHRLLVGWDAPLWLDETFTAVIATSPDVASLVHWCRNELSGPAFYTMMWTWARIAGDSDTALRLPSLACSIAAPLLIAWRGHPDARTRLVWAGLAAVWIPGLMSASEAKPYALVFLLTSAQAIAFLAMMRAPTLRTALVWSGVSAVALLTHYHTAVIGGLEGLAYLAVHRRRAVATWPAALVFAPVAAWMAIHLPIVFRFADANVAWYAVLPPRAILGLPALLFGAGVWGVLLLLVAGATTLAMGARLIASRTPPRTPPGELILAACGVAAIAIVFGVGFVRPSFTPRYLLPAMPALLFGLALWARTAERRYPQAGAALLAGATLLTAGLLAERLRGPVDDVRYVYNFERPTDWLRAQGMTRMVFLWDNPTAAITADDTLRAVSGFFNARAGRPVPILIPRFARDDDPNPRLAALATPGTGIVWAYDEAVPGSLGIRHPARLAADPRLTCRDFGGGRITVIACLNPRGLR